MAWRSGAGPPACWLGLLLLLAASAAVPTWAEEEDEEQHGEPPPHEASVAASLSVAESHIAQGRWSDALESYQGVLMGKDVSWPEAWVGAALCFRESSRPADTITALRAAINSSKQRSEREFSRLTPAVLAGRGLRRPGAGHGATAEGDDTEAKDWLSQGDELRAANQLDLAAAAYRRSVAVAGPTFTQSDAWNRLGLALMLMGAPRDAKRALEQSVCYRPFNAEGWVNYAIALKNLGGRESLAASLAALETSLKLVSGFPRALFVAGSVLKLLGQDDRAIRLYQSVLLETKDTAATADALPVAQRVEGWVNLGVLLRAKGPAFSEAALQCYRQAVVLQPTAAAANYNLGIALQEQGMLEEAAAAFGRALQAPVGDGSGWGTRGRVDAYVNMGVSLQYQGRVGDAAKLYRAAFNESNSTDVDAVLNLGNALRILGQTDEAMQAFLWTVRLNPFHLEAWILGLNLFVEQGSLPEAERTFGLILDSIPEEVPRPAVLVHIYAYTLLNSGAGHCARASPLLSGMALRQDHEAELVARVLLGHSLSACGDSVNAAAVFRDLQAQLENPASLKSSLSTFYRMNKLNLLAASTFADKAEFAARIQLIEDSEQFFPRTYQLPDERKQLIEYDADRKPEGWVIKPAYGSGGLGLQVLADISEVAKADAKEQSGLIVQQYITSPLLLDRRKFSVRLYAAVTSVVPLRVHLYRNGYVLLCSTDFEHGSAHYKDMTMQFSNAARASVDPSYTAEEPSELTSEKLLEMEVVGTGQRRTVAWLSQHAALSGIDFNTVWDKMRMAVIHAVLATEGTLAQSWTQLEQGGMPPASRRFLLPKILGVDFQLDSDWHPHLLELNPQPDLRAPEPLKLQLMRDALLLVTPTEEEPTRSDELRQQMLAREESPDGEEAVAGAAEAELEASRTSGFEPLFPAGLSSATLGALLHRFGGALASRSVDVATCVSRHSAVGAHRPREWHKNE